MDRRETPAACSQLIDEARALQDEIVADRRALHQIPEVGMSLPETRAYVTARLDELGIAWRPCGVVSPQITESYERLGYHDITESTGVVAMVGHGGPCILLRADMDALPIVEENDLPFCSTRPCSHMCGHDAHVAMLLAAARILKRHEDELPGTVKLMFQPGEELGYGSKTMIDDGLLEDPPVDVAFALHVIANAPVGRVTYTPGVASASLDTFGVRIQGRGGHTSAPQQCVDPLMVANQIYQAANLFMTREIDPSASITLSCGTMHGGTVPNVLPDTAELQGLAPDDEAYTRVIELLSQTQYRPALHNLLPWPQTASPGMTECAAYLLLTWDAETADATYLMVMDDNLLAVQLPDSEGLLIYYPDDPAALRSLQGYLAGAAQSAVQ